MIFLTSRPPRVLVVFIFRKEKGEIEMRIVVTTAVIFMAMGLPTQYVYAELTMNIPDGGVCVNSMQCESKCCRYVGDGSNVMQYCMPKVKFGEQYSSKTLYGVYYFCPCERSFTAKSLEDYDNISVCINDGMECDTCGVYIHVGKSTKCVGYEEYSHGKCGIDCGTYETVYRCSEGYYGISHSDVVVVETQCPSLCKKCPENGICHEGFNETFYCRSGYYKSNDGCSRCPVIGIDADGNEKYGQVGNNTFMHKEGINECSAALGTYTDALGTFEILSGECKYE